MKTRRVACRPKRKGVSGNELFLKEMFREHFSPQQIAGKLRTINILGYERTYVCRETIYNAIYVLPGGEFRKELREGDLSKGNASAVGTLVERISG